MTDFTVTNFSVDPHVRGGPGDDSLTVIFEGVGTGGVWLDSVLAEGGGSYAGRFNGPGANDILFSGIERFGFIDRSGGADIVATFAGNDTLDGGGGNDLLHGGAGVDRIDGGDGVDRAGVDLSWTDTAVTIDLNTVSTFLGTGRFANVEGFHDLRTGAGADRITGHRTAGVNDVIDTGAGRDRITLWMGGTDTVVGGRGSDTLILIYAIETNGVWLDSVQAEGGGSYAGRFNGMGANDVVFSGIEHFAFTDRAGGNDIIATFAGNDTLNGGGGNDLLHGGSGIDRIDGGAGVDRAGVDLSWTDTAVAIDLNTVSTFLGTGRMRGVEGFHDLRTGAGNDVVTGHRTAGVNDEIRTGAGDDRISLWMGGTDFVDGGAGTDTLVVVYDVATNGVWLDSVQAEGGGSYGGRFNGMGANDLVFSGIEHFAFTDRAGGNDIIATFAGNDTLNGGGGNDLLHGGAGVDRIDGGAGVDRAGVDLSWTDTAVTIDLDRVSTFLGTGRFANVEGFHNLRTGAGADRITGHRTAGVNDEIRTGAGDDRISLWMGGTDFVDGGAGTDTLVVVYDVATNGVWLDSVLAEGGGSYAGRFNGMGANDLVFAGIERFAFTDRAGGNDIIRGFDRADTIEGGAGNDVMAGGAGRDVFVFNRGVNEGADRIEDFQNGLDLIRLAGATFADVGIAAVNDGADTRLTFTGGTTVLLQGVAAGLIDAGDFIFT